MIEINGVQATTKFVDSGTLNAKKGSKLLVGCDAASPGRTNVIKLVRMIGGAPIVLSSKTFASCP